MCYKLKSVVKTKAAKHMSVYDFLDDDEDGYDSGA
jgi:hypothetical protein